MPQTDLQLLNVRQLTAHAAQLKVTMEVDPEILEQELAPHVNGLATLKLSAKTIEVTDEATNQQCVDLMNDAAAREKSLTGIWNRYKNPLNKARKVILDLEKSSAGVAETIKQLCSQKSGAFLLAQKRAAETINKSLASQSDGQRRELLRESQDLMLEGRVKEAGDKALQAEMIGTVSLPDLVHKPAGAKVGEKCTAECTDLMALLSAIVSREIPLMQEVKPGDVRPLIVVDQVVLNAVVARLGMGLGWPGVTVKEVMRVGVNRS